MTKTTTKRRTYKCGKCDGTGHNARTCPNGTKKETTVTKTPVTEAAPVNTLLEEKEALEKAEAEEADKPKPAIVAISETQDLTTARRGPSGRPDVASPYSCPACNDVAVLLLVEYVAGGTGLRCEKCRNSTPIKTILKWGATPSDKPS